MGLSGGKRLSANGGVLRSRTLAREVRRGLGLLIVRFSHLQVFAGCAGLKLGKTLPGRLSFLGGRVPRVAIAIEFHPRDHVGCDKLLHAFKICTCVESIGLGGFVVGPSLGNVLRTWAVAGFLKRRPEGNRVGLGLLNFFRTIAACQFLKVRSLLLDLRLRLSPLGSQIVGLKTNKQGAVLYLLALLNRDLGDTAADLRANLNLTGFDRSGVFLCSTTPMERVNDDHSPGASNEKGNSDHDQNSALPHFAASRRLCIQIS